MKKSSVDEANIEENKSIDSLSEESININAKKKTGRMNGEEVKRILDRKYRDVKWEIFEEMEVHKMREFLVNKDEGVIEAFHYIYIELMRFFLNQKDISINCICE